MPPSRSVVKLMNKFYRILEESVWRMSALGCVDEEAKDLELYSPKRGVTAELLSLAQQCQGKERKRKK